jgi:hypothetical protein
MKADRYQPLSLLFILKLSAHLMFWSGRPSSMQQCLPPAETEVPDHEQTTNRPRTGGHSWSLTVTGGQLARSSDGEDPCKQRDRAETSRSFTRQRPQVRYLYRPRDVSPGRRMIPALPAATLEWTAQSRAALRPQTDHKRLFDVPSFWSCTRWGLVEGSGPSTRCGSGLSSGRRNSGDSLARTGESKGAEWH